MDMNDAEIIQLYLNRDETAIRATADRYGTRLRALSRTITADAQTAEECENDTYLEAWKRIPPSEPTTYFFAFLARITRMLSIDRCRARMSLKRNGSLLELTEELEACLPATDDVETVVDAKLMGEAISRYLRTLPGEKQAIFLRRYFYFDSVSEISRRFGIGESKVKTTLFRLRRSLRDYLVQEGYTL